MSILVHILFGYRTFSLLNECHSVNKSSNQMVRAIQLMNIFSINWQTIQLSDMFRLLGYRTRSLTECLLYLVKKTITHRINLTFERIFVRWWRHCLNIFENVAAVRLGITGFVVSLIKPLLERRELINYLRAQVLVLKYKIIYSLFLKFKNQAKFHTELI